MSQQSIDFFYSQRKRKCDELSSQNSKVILLDQPDAPTGTLTKEVVNLTPTGFPTTRGIKLLSSKKDVINSEPKGVKTRGKAVIKLHFDGVKDANAHFESKNPDGTQTKKNVVFKKCGGLSPKKKTKINSADIASYMTRGDAKSAQPGVSSASEENVKASDVEARVADARKELSLGDIQKGLSRSSRLNELRANISKLNKGFEKLKELDEAKAAPPKTAALKGFKSIELLIPASPSKQSPCKVPSSPLSSASSKLLMSPRKAGHSPIKSPQKVPAYQRFASLATPTPTLTLPHHYRWLAEVFRAIETVSSMMHNRRETITFPKIKPAVQEMLRRNVSEKHLAQIKQISPHMYSYSQEKVKNFGATSKKDEYVLVLVPNLVNIITGSPNNTMTPEIMLDRRRSFYNLLLEKVKDHHSAFLVSLDPPMHINKMDLKRWHPEFDLEHIPDVEGASLPEPPNVERYSTAQDVLAHIKEKFNCNTRMERALQRLADAKARGLTAEEQKATGLQKDGSVSSTKPSTSESSQQTDVASIETKPTIELVNPALKGVPKALLEKIRARQAAKALESMTRTAAQEKDALLYQRLPDLAHLIHNLFVTEKKNVLTLQSVVAKLDNSFRTKMSSKDLTTHLELLSKAVPGWMTFHQFRKVDHLKIVKDADLNKIIDKLKALAEQHSL